jgi:hypothetical protein
VPTVLKSRGLNLLEPYGPIQACNGIALPLLLLLFNKTQFTRNAKNAPLLINAHIDTFDHEVSHHFKSLGAVAYSLKN